MDKARAVRFPQSGKERLGRDARMLVGDEHVFIQIDDAVKGHRFLARGRIIGDFVSRGEHDVFSRAHAVDPYVARTQQRRKGKAALRIVLVGESFQIARAARYEFFHA